MIGGAFVIFIAPDIVTRHDSRSGDLGLWFIGFLFIELESELDVFERRIELDAEKHFGGLEIDFATDEFALNGFLHLVAFLNAFYIKRGYLCRG